MLWQQVFFYLVFFVVEKKRSWPSSAPGCARWKPKEEEEEWDQHLKDSSVRDEEKIKSISTSSRSILRLKHTPSIASIENRKRGKKRSRWRLGQHLHAIDCRVASPASQPLLFCRFLFSSRVCPAPFVSRDGNKRSDCFMTYIYLCECMCGSEIYFYWRALLPDDQLLESFFLVGSYPNWAKEVPVAVRRWPTEPFQGNIRAIGRGFGCVEGESQKETHSPGLW